MWLSFIPVLILALLSLPSKSQEHHTIPKNKWKIGNLLLKRFFDPRGPELAVAFELDRIYYDPCAATEEMTSTSNHTCGMKTSNKPVFCSSWGDSNSIQTLTRPKAQLRNTCHSYRIGGEGQKPLLDAEKQWLTWRLFDLEEEKDTKVIPLSEDEKGIGAMFRSVKLQIFNGVPLIQ